LKKLLLFLGIVSTVLAGTTIAFAQSETTSGPDANNWYVCKYVGPPGTNETLQTGQNPIFVDQNSILAETGGSSVSVGDAFPDAQGHSVVVAGPYAPPGLGQESEPACPVSQPSTPPPPPPTTPPPPPTTPPPPPTTPPPPAACKPSVSFGPWYGDPRINITLTGPGTFEIRGGIQRFTNLRVVRKTLACGETFVVSRYKVKRGHSVRVYLNGTLIESRTAPRVR
jgi:hypothetical protein